MPPALSLPPPRSAPVNGASLPPYAAFIPLAVSAASSSSAELLFDCGTVSSNFLLPPDVDWSLPESSSFDFSIDQYSTVLLFTHACAHRWASSPSALPTASTLYGMFDDTQDESLFTMTREHHALLTGVANLDVVDRSAFEVRAAPTAVNKKTNGLLPSGRKQPSSVNKDAKSSKMTSRLATDMGSQRESTRDHDSRGTALLAPTPGSARESGRETTTVLPKGGSLLTSFRNSASVPTPSSLLPSFLNTRVMASVGENEDSSSEKSESTSVGGVGGDAAVAAAAEPADGTARPTISCAAGTFHSNVHDTAEKVAYCILEKNFNLSTGPDDDSHSEEGQASMSADSDRGSGGVSEGGTAIVINERLVADASRSKLVYYYSRDNFVTVKFRYIGHNTFLRILQQNVLIKFETPPKTEGGRPNDAYCVLSIAIDPDELPDDILAKLQAPNLKRATIVNAVENHIYTCVSDTSATIEALSACDDSHCLTRSPLFLSSIFLSSSLLFSSSSSPPPPSLFLRPTWTPTNAR